MFPDARKFIAKYIKVTESVAGHELNASPMSYLEWPSTCNCTAAATCLLTLLGYNNKSASYCRRRARPTWLKMYCALVSCAVRKLLSVSTVLLSSSCQHVFIFSVQPVLSSSCQN